MVSHQIKDERPEPRIEEVIEEFRARVERGVEKIRFDQVDDFNFCISCGEIEEEGVYIFLDEYSCICPSCAEQIGQIAKKEKVKEGINLLTPEEIKQILDGYVIEQDDAKKVLAVAVYNHYKRLSSISLKGVEIQKSNILLIGPTGCGKTLLAETLARFLNVPFASADATALTQAGYTGEEAEAMLLRLLENADYDIEKAKRGIVYIDEIDKIAVKSDPDNLRDVSGEGVQQALLKIVEGSVVHLSKEGKAHGSTKDKFKLDTSNILFIISGAFVGIDKFIKKRIDFKNIGFGASISSKKYNKIGEILKKVQPEDLIKFGIIPEFIGRVPIIATLNELNKDSLIRILQEPKNALVKQFKKLFEIEGVNLNFTDKALAAVATEALKRKSGARSLKSIMESSLLDTMYKIPSIKGVTRCIINEGVILKKEEPVLIYEDMES